MLKRFWILFLMVAVGAAVAVAQQGSSAELNGAVKDTTGAVIPGAQVSVTELSTNVSHTTVSNETGEYTFPALPPGRYNITATHAGFSPSQVTNVNLRVGQLLTVTVKMVVGKATTTVTVSGANQLIESGTAQLSHYASGKMLETLPVPVTGDGERQLQDFLFKSLPGTQGETYVGSINGGQNLSNEIYLDGISMGSFDTAELAPSMEAIGDFNLQTGAMGAQYNGGGTAVTNYSVKAGTNHLHGSLYEYFQNEALNANSYDSNALGYSRPKQRLNNFGGAVGGPVIIPKIYNGRNKTFFFVSYEGTRKNNFLTSGLTSMPTQAMLGGDLSGFLNPAMTGDPRSGQPVMTSSGPVVDALGRPIVYGQVYDPATQRIVHAGEVDPVTGLTAVSTGLVRDPFKNNQIPTGRFNTVAANYLKLKFPTNFANEKVVNNLAKYANNQPVFTQKDLTIHLDENLTSNQRVDFYITTNSRNRSNSGSPTWSIPGTNPLDTWDTQDTPGKLVRANDYWTISPNAANHFGVGYNRFTNKYVTPFSSQNWGSTLGIQNMTPTAFPVISIGASAPTLGSEDSFGNGANGSGAVEQSTVFLDNFSLTRGKQQLQIGTEWRFYNVNEDYLNSPASFGFGSMTTDDGLGSAKYTGNGFASFLLGQVSSEGSSVNDGTFGFRRRDVGTYVQDNWRVTHKLTLNLGLRWEIMGGIYEVHGKMTTMNPTTPNPGAGNLPGALQFAGQLGKKTFENTDWGLILPRFGFAYAVSPRWVWRGGIGWNSQAPEGGPGLVNSGTPSTLGYSGTIQRNSTTNPQPDPDMAVASLSDPFPSFTGVLPNYDPTLANGQGSPNYVNPNGARDQYVVNYNFGFQYAIARGTVAEINYVGNTSRRITAYDTDQMNQLPLSDLAQYGDALLDPLSQHPNIPSPYPGFDRNNTVQQALAPFPQYAGGSVNMLDSHFGWSRFDSLQATLTRRMHNGLSFIAAYTWEKNLTNANSGYTYVPVRNVYNLKAEKTIAIGLDVPQQFKITAIYDLPFGHGRTFALHGPLDWVAGGWALSGNAIYQSGDVLSVYDSGVNNGIFSTTTPNYTGEPVEKKGSGAINYINGTGPGYLNPGAFTHVQTSCDLVAAGAPCNNVALATGNVKSALGNVFGPGLADENFSLQKNFAFGESRYFQVRVDAVNAFNRAGKGDPVNDINNPQFGQVVGPGTDSQNIDSDSYFYQPRVVQLAARINF